MIKDILVATTGSSVDEIRLSVAEALGERHGAALSVIAVNPMRVATTPPAVVPGFGAGALATPMPDLTMAATDEAADSTQSALETRFSNRPEVRLLRLDDTAAGIQSRVADLCRTKDLFVTSAPQAENGILTAVHEAVLADGTTPVLVLPAEADPLPMFRRVCIAWNGSPECARALHHAMPIVALAEAVHIIMVDHLRSAGEDVVDKTEVERHLTAHGVTSQILLVASGDMKTAAAIIAEAERVDADLLVAGSHDRSGLLDWFGASVSKDLMRKSRLPLLLAR